MPIHIFLGVTPYEIEASLKNKIYNKIIDLKQNLTW